VIRILANAFEFVKSFRTPKGVIFEAIVATERQVVTLHNCDYL